MVRSPEPVPFFRACRKICFLTEDYKRTCEKKGLNPLLYRCGESSAAYLLVRFDPFGDGLNGGTVAFLERSNGLLDQSKSSHGDFSQR